VRVLHVAHSIANSYGGPTQSLKGFLAAAEFAGAKASVVTQSCAADDSAGIEKVAEDVHEFRAFGSNAFSVSPGLLRWLNNNVANYDVVHVHGLFNPISSLGARTCIRRGVPTVIRPFGTLSMYTFAHRRQKLKQAWFNLVERNNLRSASAIHFTTEAERDEAARHGLEFGERAHIVPPPVLLADVDTNPIRRENVVLFLSRLHPVKNIEALIAAWLIVASERAGWKLVIAGSGDPGYEAIIRTLAASSEAGRSIEVTGFVTGTPKDRILSTASVFVLPSRHENFGVAVLEAIGAGIPVVITPEVQLAPFVVSHALGIVSSPDAPLLAAAIIQAIDDEDLRARVARTGRNLVQGYFGPEAIGQRLMSMYASAIAQSGN
jgi:glycosyltransferase involved in cell wall biosynthesis